MGRITVVGAGVIGQVYAGLLAEAGHTVTVVARGARAARLRAAGVVLDREGRRTRPVCAVAGDLAEAGGADALIVAVRGDQLATVQSEVAASSAAVVVCLSAPLGLRESFAREVGAARTVYAFSGVGGFLDDDGVVHYHVVRQQPTIVDVAAPRGGDVAAMLEGTGLPVERETRMPDWLATHAVFIAGIGSALLAAGGAEGVARSRSLARELVVALPEGFDALEVHGTEIRPRPLRAIFGRVPTWIAARYWRRQFAGPTVRVSIEPHVLATRDSEFPRVVDFARALAGERPVRFRRLLDAGAKAHGTE